MKQQFVQNLMYRGMKLDDYLGQIGKTEEQWEKEDCVLVQKSVSVIS